MISLDAYKLKLIAIIGMILNHIPFALFEVLPYWLNFPLYVAGGLTFPIMAFFVVEGYKHTSNLKRYMLRLFVFGVISIPFHILVFRMIVPNIMFTIILSLLVLVLHDKIKIRPFFWILFVLILIVSMALMMDWYFIGIIVVLLYHKIQKESTRRVLPGIIAGVFWFVMSLFAVISMAWAQATGVEIDMGGISPIMMDIRFMTVTLVFIIGCIAAAFLLKGYNGERGKRMKWMFYAFYPLHLAVLSVLALAFGLVDLSVFGF